MQQHALPSRERPSTDAQPQDAEGDAVVARALARVVRAADPAAGEAESKRHGAIAAALDVAPSKKTCARASSDARATRERRRDTRR